MRTKSIYILLTISIFLSMGTGLLIYFGEVEKTEDTRRLLHTHEVIHTANQLYALLLDAETGQRGYLITASNEYLKPYTAAIDEVNNKFNQLDKILSNDPQLQQILDDELQPAIQKKKTELKETIRLFNQEGGEEALALTATDTGIKQMEIIRNALNKIIDHEEQLLTQRRKQLDQSFLLFNIIAYGGLFFIGITIIASIITIYRQDTTNKELIEQLEQSNTMLSELHDREVQLSDEKSKFMRMAAHDLRSPLNAIISLTDLIKDDDNTLTNEQLEYLNYISGSALKMSDMINNFLDVQKIEEGENNTPETEEVNVSIFLKAIIMGFQTKAMSKDITLTFNNDYKEGTFCTDKAMFSQIAENLISNAIKYSPKNTTITVSLRKSPEHGQLVLEVEDEGLGMNEKEIDQIFEPYADISTEPTGNESSTGLGLSIVKNRVDTLDGTITCKSEKEQGTTFEVHLPELDCKQVAS